MDLVTYCSARPVCLLPCLRGLPPGDYRQPEPKALPDRRRRSGSVAIEFAIVFPIFFLIFYAIVSYGLILIAQQSITLAAAEGARAAVRYAADDATRSSNAQSAATGPGSTASWLSGHLTFTAAALANCPYNAGSLTGRCYRVTVTYPNYAQDPLVPRMLGSIPLPDQLSSSAVAQLD